MKARMSTRLLGTILLGSLCVGLALTIQWWAPSLLNFFIKNADLTQGIMGLLEILLWACAGIVVLIGWWCNSQNMEQRKEENQDTQHHRAKLEGSGGIAQNQSTAADERGVVTTDFDGIVVTGDNNIITQIIRRGIDNEENAEPNLYLQIDQYLTWIQARFRFIGLRGMQIQGQQLQLDLETAYVPINVDPYQFNVRIRMDKVLSLGTKIVVTGTPGSGKTTMLQYIAWFLATAIKKERPELCREQLGLQADIVPLPVLVPLEAYAEHHRKYKDTSDPSLQTLESFISIYLIKRQTSIDLKSDFTTGQN